MDETKSSYSDALREIEKIVLGRKLEALGDRYDKEQLFELIDYLSDCMLNPREKNKHALDLILDIVEKHMEDKRRDRKYGGDLGSYIFAILNQDKSSPEILMENLLGNARWKYVKGRIERRPEDYKEWVMKMLKENNP